MCVLLEAMGDDQNMCGEGESSLSWGTWIKLDLPLARPLFPSKPRREDSCKIALGVTRDTG